MTGIDCSKFAGHPRRLTERTFERRPSAWRPTGGSVQVWGGLKPPPEPGPKTQSKIGPRPILDWSKTGPRSVQTQSFTVFFRLSGKVQDRSKTNLGFEFWTAGSGACGWGGVALCSIRFHKVLGSFNNLLFEVPPAEVGATEEGKLALVTATDMWRSCTRRFLGSLDRAAQPCANDLIWLESFPNTDPVMCLWLGLTMAARGWVCKPTSISTNLDACDIVYISIWVSFLVAPLCSLARSRRLG